jgi:Leucine-rich repeat (LRR) protein
LTALKDLQTLTLGRDTVSMNVTDASIPSLRSLRSLANLDVMGTQVSKKGVEELKAALPACTIVGDWNRPEPGMRVIAFPVEKDLGEVYTSNSAEDGPLAWLYQGRAQGSLSVLKESILRLDATAEAVSDFRSVLNANLTDLHTLAIPGLVVGDGVLSGLESVQGLRCLMMPFVKVAPSTKERIGKLVTLQELDLGHADIGNDDLKLINSLTELRTLRLAGNQITEAGVAHLGDLVKLQELDLASNPIEDGAVQYLQKLSGLKRLYLEGTKVSDAAVASLQGILPECLITHTLTVPQSEPLRYPARTMKFPNRSVGTLRTRPAGSQDEWSVFGEAKGEASIPENQEVMLELADGAESSMPDIAKLGAEGPDVLDARNATVTDDALNQVSNMASLYALYISDQHYGRGTNVTAEGLRALEKLPKLAALKAGGRIGYSEEAFSTLGAIPTLKQLDLTGADWAGPCLAYLRGLPGLSELKVSGRMLNDIDLHHVAALSSLRTLQIDNMAVSAAGLAHLRAATQLQAVNLSGAWWNSPDMDLRHMAALPNLKQFKLTGVNVSEKGAAALAQSQSIEDLQLVHGRLSDKSVAPLANLRSLRRLDLSQNQFIVGNCLAALAGLPSLESLSLDATRLTDDALLALISMTSLRELDVRITGLTLKGFQQFAKVPSLESLACDKVTDEMLNEICLLQRLKKLNMDSDWIRRFTDQGASCLGNLRQIEELSLGYAGLTSEGLASLANLGSLRVLGLKGCKDIGDKGLKHLEGLQNLRRLDLTSTGVTQEGLSVLREKLPLCEITTSDHMARTVHFPQDRSLGKVGKGHPYLVLRNFEKAFSEAAPAQGDVAVPVDQVACLAISQEAAKDLSPLATLNASDVHAIVLKDVPIDGKQLSHLGTLTDLRSLDLANTGVADKDLAFLDKLNALEMLDLSGTFISNSALKRLADKTSLRVLRLKGTDVDDGAVPVLEHLHVGELDVTDTLITEEGANILKKALGERTVKHSMANGPHVRPVRSATDTASAVSPASSPNTSPEPPQAKPVQTLEKRILRFPRGTVVGVLYLRDAGAASEQPWTRVSYVMGNVNVPAGKEARLKLEVEVASTLAKLAPDDLQALDLTGLKSRGDDWRQVKRLTGLNLLVLTDTGASDAVIKDLRRSLPKCVIVP